MKVAFVRVGIDSGCGGMQGPLFSNGEFEFVPIPDDRNLDERTYGNTAGRTGIPLVNFFPAGRQLRFSSQSIHFDPEFVTFTYGDPTSPKQGLRRLEKGDLLAFYAGLEGYGFSSAPALYLIGYFEIEIAGYAKSFSQQILAAAFSDNFHVAHPDLFAAQRETLVLVKGSSASRLYTKAHLLSVTTVDRRGRLLKVISPAMRAICGDFQGRYSFQRSPVRWVEPAFVSSAASFLRSLT